LAFGEIYSCNPASHFPACHTKSHQDDTGDNNGDNNVRHLLGRRQSSPPPADLLACLLPALLGDVVVRLF
jgi:hypothetical protein